MILYTLFWADTGIILQGGDAPNDGCLPIKDAGQDILLGVAGNNEVEKVDISTRTLVPYAPIKEQETLVAEIIRERQRRFELGFEFSFGDDDPRGVHRFGTTEADMLGWNDVTVIAQAHLNLGNPAGQIFIETETGSIAVSAVEWQRILMAGGQRKQEIWLKSFELQKLNPIPQNVSDPSHWE